MGYSDAEFRAGESGPWAGPNPSLTLSAATADYAAILNSCGRFYPLPGQRDVAERVDCPLFSDVVSFIVVFGLFALLSKMLPDVRLQWRDVLAGSIAAALLFLAGKYLLSLYLSHEITKVYAKHHGAELELSSDAVPKTAS
jgi:hypothetical protein